MSTHATDDMDEVAADEQGSQYADLTIGDEEFVIYDRENHQAWIQSSTAFSVVDIR
jgi:hypothetical protein